jgi:hypothetical protein
MTRIGRKTIRRAERYLNKYGVSVLVAKKIIGKATNRLMRTTRLDSVDRALSLGAAFVAEQAVSSSSQRDLPDDSLRTAHAGQENIHDGVSSVLEFAIAFALCNPG